MLNEELQSHWTLVPDPRIPRAKRYQLVVDRSVYDQARDNINFLSLEADKKAKELRAFQNIAKWKSDFDKAQNLERSQVMLMESLNKTGDFPALFTDDDVEAHVHETLDRYHSGERNNSENPLPSDRLLNILSEKNNGISSHQEAYSILIFPEKDLKPVIDRLNIEKIDVSYFNNGRENSLVYTVKEPDGTPRSFTLYEHRNTDSLIVNGRAYWDPNGDEFPYAGNDSWGFFAEFGPNEHRQAAETLGYLMKSAERGDLETDDELVALSERRDWSAILSDTVPGYTEWAMEQLDKEDE